MRAASKAWIGLAAGIIAYDVLAPPGETLSEACDRAMERYPVGTILTIGTVALHLANVLPQSIDPIHQLAKRIRNV